MRAAGRGSGGSCGSGYVAVVVTIATVAGYALADVTGDVFTAGIDGFAAGALLVMLIDTMIPDAAKDAGRVAGSSACSASPSPPGSRTSPDRLQWSKTVMQPVIVAGVPTTGLPPCGVAVQQPKPLTVTSKERAWPVAAGVAAPFVLARLRAAHRAAGADVPPSELAIAPGVTPMNGVGRITKMAPTTSRATKVAT